MTYYLDSDFRVHTEQDETGSLTPWEDEVGFFTGKCKTFVEGYRVVPEGKTWTRGDGMVFHGEMFAPAVGYDTLKAAQAEYENGLAELEDMRAALALLGVNADG